MGKGKKIVKRFQRLTSNMVRVKARRNNLLKSSDTKIIHIRPHAKDSKDIDKPYFGL
jgi:hypothetical protein